MKPIRLLALLFLVSFGTTVFLMQLSMQPEAAPVRVEIASGESLQSIAQTLKRHGLIRSAAAFRLYLKAQGIDTGIQPGTFLIEPGMSFGEIATMLGEGREAVVTIPEGYTVSQIDGLLARKGLIQQGEFSTLARGEEGYLFPDTYYVNVGGFEAEVFLGRMRSTFEKRVVRGLATEIGISGRSLEDIVIMASLIERETRTDEERPIVSGILWKRLDTGIGLDVDASLRYALRKIDGDLTREDLQFDSPYNTRRYRGLPPGPIANPGLASIRAALQPGDSPYWYYLHGRDGRIHYSETNEEHNEKKGRYL